MHLVNYICIFAKSITIMNTTEAALLQHYRDREYAYVELHREGCNCQDYKYKEEFKKVYQQEFPDRYKEIIYLID